jgi:hypothetical protein
MSKRLLYGVEVEPGRNPAHTEHLYRKKWLKKHIDEGANVIVCDENTRLPVRAEYHYPHDFEQEVEEKSFTL